MAGIRAEKGFKVSKIEFPAITGEFPSPIWIFREFFLYKKSEIGDGNSSKNGGKFKIPSFEAILWPEAA